MIDLLKALGFDAFMRKRRDTNDGNLPDSPLGAHGSYNPGETDDLFPGGVIQAQQATIGGWKIGDTSLVSGTSTKTVGMNSDGTKSAFYAGSDDPQTAPFRVSPAGVLVATSATITGSITSTSGTIGGWTIGATTLTGGNLTLNSSGSIALTGSGGAGSWSTDGVVATLQSGIVRGTVETSGAYVLITGTAGVGVLGVAKQTSNPTAPYVANYNIYIDNSENLSIRRASDGKIATVSLTYV